jgi:negative regulator of replication initiation
MEARKNNFGRKLFEQYATEFMVSFYSESKEIKKLNEALASQAAKLNEAQSKVGEQQKFVEAANRKVKLAEEKATRVVEMNRLMAPLDKSKRKVMEGLLESTKTEGLSEAFNRFLPHVINGSSKSSSAPTPATRSVNVLNENKPIIEKKTVIEVTGNKTNKLSESVKADEVNSTDKADILNLRRLAGLVD